MEDLKIIARTAKNITFGYIFFTVVQNAIDMIKSLFNSFRRPKSNTSASQPVSLDRAIALLPAGDQLAVRDAFRAKAEGKALTQFQLQTLKNITDSLNNIGD
jgi:hypothetical protein